MSIFRLFVHDQHLDQFVLIRHSTFTPEQRAIKDAVILFSVKDKDLFGMSNQYLAECYLSFNDIADISGESGKIEQKHLKLTRPHRLGN